MVRQGWGWNLVYQMVATTYFGVMSGYKFGLANTHFSHPDWVSLDWFRPFTSAQPFQSLTMSILSGWTRLRLEFILHNHHRTPTFESRVVKISAPCLYVSHQDWVCTDWFSHFISSPAIQSLINSIINDYRQGWDWNLVYQMVATIYFRVMSR